MLNYRKGDATSDDEGYNQQDSIRPCENSEPANETYLNRGPYNLHYRTEEVRVAFDRLEAVERSDRSLVVMAAPDTKVELKDDGGGSYWFKVNDGLADYNRPVYFVPIISTALPAGGTPIYASLTYNDGGGGVFTIDVDGNRKVVDGAHNILFRMFKGTQSLGTNPVVTVEGTATPLAPDPTEGPVAIVVELSVDDDTTITSVVSAINTHAGASSIVTAAVTSGGTNVITSDYSQRRLFEGDTGSMGGVDNEGFHVPATAWDNFFDPGTGNKRMAEGDILVIDKENAYDRLDSDPSVSIPWTQLRIVSEDSRNTADMNVIPVAKIWDGKMYFMNGKVFEVDTPDYVAFGNKSVDDLRDELANQTGTPYGDYMVGGEAKTAGSFFTLSAGTVNAQMKSFLSNIEDHLDGSVAGLKHPYRDLTNKPIVTVSPPGSGYVTDYTSIIDAWNAIRLTGGVIQLTDGTFEETLTGLSTAANAAIVIRGMGVEETIWKHTNGVPNPIIKVDSNLSVRSVRFENISFDQDSDNTVVRFDTELTIPTGVTITFSGCVFDGHNSITGSKPMCQVKNGMFVFERCFFIGESQNCPAISFSTTAAFLFGGVYAYQNAFFSCGQIIDATDIYKCHFVQNTFETCGIASATPKHLVDIDGTGTYDVQLNGNCVTSYAAAFCKMSAANADVRIVNNTLAVGTDTTPSAVTFALDITASNTFISGNNVGFGKTGGIKLSCAGKVFDNKFYSANLENVTGQYAVHFAANGDYGMFFHDNEISLTDSDFDTIVYVGRPGVQFNRNTVKITNAPDPSSGDIVEIVSDECHCNGNHLQISQKDGWDAVHVTGDSCEIRGNVIRNTAIGVLLDSCEYCHVCENNIVVSNASSGNTIGVDVSSSSSNHGSHVIAGNTMRVTGAAAGPSAIGIRLFVSGTGTYELYHCNVTGNKCTIGSGSSTKIVISLVGDNSGGNDGVCGFHNISGNICICPYVSSGIKVSNADDCRIADNLINNEASSTSVGVYFTNGAYRNCYAGNHITSDVIVTDDGGVPGTTKNGIRDEATGATYVTTNNWY